jgi:hypothetical protein
MLSFFLTAPTVVYSPGFPFLSLAGQFLLNDLVLVAASLMLVALDVARRRANDVSSVSAVRTEVAELRHWVAHLERSAPTP